MKITANNAKAEGPLVTFALIAYNQEKFIREAIEAAFLQDYPRLEIILSDDRSSDNTFKIMKEMAKDYSGPHRVIVRQSATNQCTFNHVLDVAKEAHGELIVLAAGDDVSYPHRVSAVAQHWLTAQTWALYANADLVSEDGQLLQANRKPQYNSEMTRWLSRIGIHSVIHGATSAYYRDFLLRLPKSRSPIVFEDAVLTNAIALLGGKFEHIPKSLIAYRRNEGAASNSGSQLRSMIEIRKSEERLANAASWFIALCEYLADISEMEPEAKSKYERMSQRINSTRRYFMLRRDWIDAPLSERLMLAFQCGELRALRFVLPRLFGVNFFSGLKYYLLVAPKQLLQ